MIISVTERKLITLLEEVKTLMAGVKQSIEANTAAVKALAGGKLPNGQVLPTTPMEWPAGLPKLPLDSLFHLKEFESKLVSQKNVDVVVSIDTCPLGGEYCHIIYACFILRRQMITCIKMCLKIKLVLNISVLVEF